MKAFFLCLTVMPAANCAGQVGVQAGAQSGGVVTVTSATQAELAPNLQSVFATRQALTLIPRGPQAHAGKIWLRTTEDGLHIWGKIEADEDGFRWAREKSEMLASDHVEVWLAAAPEVEMPTIGWGNQFGTNVLSSAKDCAGILGPENNGSAEQIANCERWYGEQVEYRRYLKRLFVRQWLIAGGRNFAQTHVFEDFASTAWAGLNGNLYREDMPEALGPQAIDGVTVVMGQETKSTTRHEDGRDVNYQRLSGYDFHVFIPYSAFPPAQELTLSDLYLMVDVFSAAPDGRKMGDYSTTSAGRKWGDPETFNHLRLAAPRTFSITPCEDKPEQQDLYDKNYAVWFFPTMPGKDADLRTTFALMNPAGGYLYEPGGVSPEADKETYFWKMLADGASVCGPLLAWRKGASVVRGAFGVDKTYFETKALPDGWTLVRSGPFTTTQSPFGSGQCGACLTMGFDLFSISPQGEIAPALTLDESMSGEGGSPDATDLAIAPDWKRITLYRDFEEYAEKNRAPHWNSTSYCLQGHTYTKCGEEEHATPPNPPNFKELRQDE